MSAGLPMQRARVGVVALGGGLGLAGLAAAATTVTGNGAGASAALAMAAAANVAMGAIAYAAMGRAQGHSRRLAQDNAQLARAKAVAESASFAKSRYLADISHDIRSPLNAIYGYAQLVERAGSAQEVPQEAASVIRRCTEHINAMVEGLLDIAQVENGVLRIKTETVDFESFLEQIVRMVRPAASSKGLAFVYAPQGRLPGHVRMDQGRLRQILLNLLFNAVKYSDSGSVTLAVRYSNQIATFEVRDTGPGIAPQDQAEIFEAFRRGSDAATDKQAGAGLGLSIARTLAEILGGQLDLVESTKAGTVFRLALMLGETNDTSAGAPASAKRRIVGYEGPSRRVLVVDDEAENRDLMARLLRPLGFDVLVASGGEAALALCEAYVFDLAVLDISMAGMSGWQVAAALRQRWGDGVRILMLSGNAQEFHKPALGPDLAAVGFEPAHDRFLLKPVAYDALVEALGSLAGLVWRREGEDEADEAEPEIHDGALDVVAQGHIERLQELLRIGYVRGIEAEIRLLAEAAPAAKALTGELYACLDRFDLAAMARILERY